MQTDVQRERDRISLLKAKGSKKGELPCLIDSGFNPKTVIPAALISIQVIEHELLAL